MNLEVSEKSFYSNPDKSLKLISKSVVKLRGSLRQVRASIYALRPHPSQKVGLVQAIQDRIIFFEEENNGIQIRQTLKGTERPLESILEKGIFDIFKECLRNIEKHAHATKVRIYVGFLEDSFCLCIKDNGEGFSLGETMIRAKINQSFGILSMNDLSDQLGVSLDIQSRIGNGTKIVLFVPYSFEGEIENND